MQVRFLRDWKRYRAGRVIDPPDGMANLLLARGIVAAAEAPPKDEEPVRRKPKPRRSA